jgi:vanillate/4-hydroxybenzoate decarboxylase subunit D
MKCPRCDGNKIEVIATSPVGNVWEVYECMDCFYSWRSTETPNVHEKFKLTKEQINHLPMIPPIPPLDK